MNSIHIRELKFEDLEQVFKLGEKEFSADNWPILYRTWDEYEIIERFMSDSEYCLVAEDKNGKIVGFVLGTLIKKKRSTWIYGYIIWIAIKREFQKQGIGKRMISTLIRRFKKSGVNMLMIDTSPENHPTIRFFEKQGFSKRVEHIYMFKNLTKKH